MSASGTRPAGSTECRQLCLSAPVPLATGALSEQMAGQGPGHLILEGRPVPLTGLVRERTFVRTVRSLPSR